MAKLNKKVTKAAAGDVKLAKVSAKSVTIQKPDKKAKENPVKNLKSKVDKTQRIASNGPPAKASPKKKANKNKKDKPKKVNLQKKTTTSGGAPIVPKKNAKKLPSKPQIKPAKELVSREDIGKSVTAFKAALQTGLAEKKAMLDPDFRYILQLCCFKIPQCPERMARTQLTHSLYDETDDVCLFVKDIEAGHKRDYQPTIDYFREKLDAAGITNIKAIMPMSQLAKDYKQSEMLRKLSNTYDCFLADSRIAPHLAKMLGKHFTLQKKSPIPVRMNHKQLKEHLERATAKVQYHQTNSGDSIAIPIGKHCMDEEKVVENVHATLQNMFTEFHGGWANLKRAYLRPAMNIAKSSVLVYNNPSNGANVPIPVVAGPRATALAEKQKKLNKLLPDGMVVTNKGELALVASRKNKETASAEVKNAQRKQKKEKLLKKKNKSKTGDVKEASAATTEEKLPVEEKKQKKKLKEIILEQVAEVPAKKLKPKKGEEPKNVIVEAEKPAEKKKAKKTEAKVATEEIVPDVVVDKKKAKKTKQAEAKVPEPVAPVPVVAAEKKSKKAKATSAVDVAAATLVPETKKKGKKEKKTKSTSEDVDDANLSKEVSDLWEQIKNESAAELGDLDAPNKKTKNKRKAAAAVVAKDSGDNKKKKPKK